MTEGTLYSYVTSDVSLSEAIQEYKEQLKNAIALLYSPESCQFAKLDPSGNLTDSKGKSINLDYQENYIFEARIFNPDCELRWLNKANGGGCAVLISEQKLSNLSDCQEESFLATIGQQYLLWQKKTKTYPSEGWVRLSTARIGSLDVPLNQSITEDQRVYLKTIEYLNEVDKFGNVAIIEERLIKLEVN